MNKNVPSMLEKIYDLFFKKFKDERTSWDHFIEFIAIDNQGSLFFEIPHKFEWLFEDQNFCKSVLDIYDSKLIRSDYYDHLGELYFKRVIKQSEKLISLKQADTIILNYLEKTDKQIKILIPNAQTGRVIMAVKEIANKAMVYGIEPDIRLYRIALTNMIIHNIKGYILCTNKPRSDVNDIVNDSKNKWKYANAWCVPSTQLIQTVEKQTTLLPKDTFPKDMVVIDSGGLT